MGEELTAAQEASIRRRQTFRLATIAVIVAAAAALAIDNRQEVTLGYVVGEREAPLGDRAGRRLRARGAGEFAVDASSAWANRVIRSALGRVTCGRRASDPAIAPRRTE